MNVKMERPAWLDEKDYRWRKREAAGILSLKERGFLIRFAVAWLWMEGFKPGRIAKILHYSRESVHRYIRETKILLGAAEDDNLDSWASR